MSFRFLREVIKDLIVQLVRDTQLVQLSQYVPTQLKEMFDIGVSSIKIHAHDQEETT